MDSPIGFDTNATIGAYQIGVLVSYVLFGVMTAQMYIYYSRFPNDDLRLKALVAFVWVFEVSHAICIGHTLYEYTVLDYAHPERILGPVPKSLAISAIFSGMVAVCVQGFFSFRIYVFSQKIYVPALICILTLLQLVGSAWGWLLTTIWSITASNDVLVTLSLVTILIRQRSHALRRTVALMDKLILWAIETGMLTSAAALTAVICFVAVGTNFVWLAGHIIVPKVISNSLLANLNSREVLRGMNDVTLSSVLPAVSLRI
ncbi:hypothetical protein B0H14DRAFT_3518321 [Mycena olivaceomarginata]|nr:hypothetical protein B0H14DRAFT_3518321 [Mycena olivaceomarginata]